MPACGKHKILSIGKIRWPSVTGEHHAHCQVLVDNDHRCSRMIRSVGVCLAAEERIGDKIGVERSLELVGQVSGGDPGDDLATCVGYARVTRSPAKAPLLDQVRDCHVTHDASSALHLATGSRTRFVTTT